MLSSIFGFLSFCSFGEKLILIKNGESSYTIIIGKNASVSEHHAAEELQDFIREISGCTLPIKSDEEAPEQNLILVGQSKLFNKLNIALDSINLGNEGFIIKTENNNLILAGGRLRGTLYSVYTFLEDVLGCRWYSSKVSEIPRMTTIAISNLNSVQKPAFEYREPFWTEAFDGDWAVRNKCNGSSAHLDAARGGKIAQSGVHTFYQDHIISPKRYFENHPEYFSLLNKKRAYEQAQLCLTNPELMRLTTQKTIEWIERDTEGTIFSISQNDWGGVCGCKACMTVDSLEESHSGSLIQFINGIAERTGRVHPDKFISTLAYRYTEKPPKHVRPIDNVVIRLCHMTPSCEMHPVESCPMNKGFKQNLNGWKTITKKLFVWDYCVNFAHYLLPFPNFNVFRSDISYFHKMNVNGVFCQGDYAPGGGGEMAELKAYVLAKLLWNPSIDVRKVIDDFLEGYFGSAGKSIKKYINLLQDKVRDDNIHADLYSPPNSGYLTEDILQEADEYFDRAEKSTDNEEQLQRVRKCRLSVQYAKLSMPIPYVTKDDKYVPDPSCKSLASGNDLVDFMKSVRKFGITQLFENLPLEITEQWIKMRNASYDIISLNNSWLHIEVIPGLGGRISKMVTMNNNWNLLRDGDIQDYTYPASGGYTEMSLWTSPYVPFDYKYNTVVEGERVVMTATLGDFQRQGIAQMTRMITLLKDRPVLEIFTSLKCLQPYEQNLQIIASYKLNDGNPDSVVVGFTDHKNAMHPLLIFQETQEITHRVFHGGDIAGGMWSISNFSKKIGLIDRFYPESVKECAVQLDKKKNSISIEMIGKPIRLSPGDRLSFRHLIEITEKPFQFGTQDSMKTVQSNN